MDANILYPYLTPALMSPEQAEITILLGHGVHVELVEDYEGPGGIVHKFLMPDVLREAGLTATEAHRIALGNLEKWFAAAWVAEEEVLSVKMFGKPGDEWHFLLFSHHPRAAACLRLPQLFDLCQRFLESDALCACVPQRASLVVFPTRDRQYRETLVAKLREIERDARRPISFALFEVLPGEVRPFMETDDSPA